MTRLREVRGEAAYSDAARPEDGPVRELRLRCAAGHKYSGIAQNVWAARRDGDGFRWWEERTAYVPERCIVCGNLTDGEVLP
jgi:hypothetical protein